MCCVHVKCKANLFMTDVEETVIDTDVFLTCCDLSAHI